MQRAIAMAHYAATLAASQAAIRDFINSFTSGMGNIINQLDFDTYIYTHEEVTITSKYNSLNYDYSSMSISNVGNTPPKDEFVGITFTTANSRPGGDESNVPDYDPNKGYPNLVDIGSIIPSVGKWELISGWSDIIWYLHGKDKPPLLSPYDGGFLKDTIGEYPDRYIVRDDSGFVYTVPKQ